MRWFIRLPRYGRPMAALNRNGIDIERRSLTRVPGPRVSLANLLAFMKDAMEWLAGPPRTPRLPLLFRRVPYARPGEFPHIPRGNRVLTSEE